MNICDGLTETSV